ncbi:MAG: tRNA preQ1(34) S-adenosylmethionine ribosyltransferase-isomerase QueA [Acidimicrobiia bacterium]|nr:tRNA preQ1(34) S-adenosylmethionine ribosyltransferase-isomerase QueA [Acidimicrobiia bacterium]NNL70180.1 tRNA preQ1(34) S-adenosylmethionine ribosyltransferase-isomerase QueA [Acidimicrobiia bacterium]
MKIDEFDYELPATAIAQRPAEPRDSSRLLVADEPLVDTSFAKLPDYLREGDLLVLNDTRVRAARLIGTRPGGGRVELLMLRPHGPEWEALARPARKLRTGMQLHFEGVSAEVVGIAGAGRVRVRLNTTEPEATIAAAGSVPYPPYIIDGPADSEKYQTVYARTVGSAAAPTAGLHFTPELLARIGARGVRLGTISLEIGLDTFRPITVETIDEHVMHTERFDIPEATAAAIAETRADGGRVVAVGTTSVRALESAADQTGAVQPGRSATGLFITPGYRPVVVDALLTNFHMPRSSLVVMVAALLPAWRPAYEHAIEAGYRFLSFGDAMLIPQVR